jgi:hypothetical protein
VRDSPPNRPLYDALLKERYAESSEGNITAAVEQEGIMVACRGESAFYTADEAREIAAGLEQSIDEDTSVEEMADLIEFLRYGADKLDDTTTRGSFHEEFQRWR